MKRFFLVTLLALLQGCSVFSTLSKNPGDVQAGINLAVGETILAQKTPAAESALAKDIVQIAATVQADAEQVKTVAGLVALAQAEAIKLPNPQEVLAVQTLLIALQPVIQQYVGTSLGTTTALTDLSTFLGWVTTAATPYESL